MTVAVVGLGAMGSRIAGRLLDAGYDVVVWNRTAEKAKPLVERGAKPAESPDDAAVHAEALITMVTDAPALESVLSGIAPGSLTVIQMSTVGRAVAPRFPKLLDAPVLGSIGEAESGSLTIFVGGPEALVERWMPLLSVLGKPIRVGDIGDGQAAKLVANATLVGLLGLLGEALALGEGLGLPREVVFEVLAATPLAQQAERRRPALEADDFPPRFPLALARKDADLIAAVSADLRLTSAARSWFAEAEAAGLGGEDYAAVLRYILRKSNRR